MIHGPHLIRLDFTLVAGNHILRVLVSCFLVAICSVLWCPCDQCSAMADNELNELVIQCSMVEGNTSIEQILGGSSVVQLDNTGVDSTLVGRCVSALVVALDPGSAPDQQSCALVLKIKVRLSRGR